MGDHGADGDVRVYKAPSIQRPRDVYDAHGNRLGRSEGFQPDPGSGGLGIELEIEEAARNLLDTETTRTWLSADQVTRVYRDRMVLALTLRELRLRLREQALWKKIELSDAREHAET